MCHQVRFQIVGRQSGVAAHVTGMRPDEVLGGRVGPEQVVRGETLSALVADVDAVRLIFAFGHFHVDVLAFCLLNWENFVLLLT